ARISFTSPATGPKILGFNIYRSATARGVYELLNDEGRLARRPVTTFIDTGVKSADLFYYRITSVGRNGIESAPVTVRI
ncbi:MAG TPA: hypothetical protein VGB55_09825, partial [Tepidisphaeraceae bacterium]